MNSSRLSGKVLAPIMERPVLERMVERLRAVDQLDQIVIATTTNNNDEAIADLATELGIGFWRGSEDDVLQRVLDAAHAHEADVIVELTGDCPLIDPRIVSTVIDTYHSAGVDYVSNVLTRSYPIGMDTQVFSTKVLNDVARRTSDPADHEHVSLFIYRNPDIYSLANVEAPEHECHPELRLTLDTAQDLYVIRHMFEALYPRDPMFGLSDMLRWLKYNPDIAVKNADVEHRYV